MGGGVSIDDYKRRLESHDWTYMMSDDHSVYLRGASAESHLMATAREHGDEFKRAFNEAFAKVFHRHPFVKPYNAPFPEVAP